MKRYNLKFWRMRQGLTQAELAKKLGISTGHYKSIENGVHNPSKKILDKFCDEVDLGGRDSEIANNLAFLFKKI